MLVEISDLMARHGLAEQFDFYAVNENVHLHDYGDVYMNYNINTSCLKYLFCLYLRGSVGK